MGALVNPIDAVLGLVIVVAIAAMLLWVVVLRPRRMAHPRSVTRPAAEQTIIVAVDSSHESDRALDLACGLAAERHARLILTNVIPVPMRFALDAPLPGQDYRAESVLECAVARVTERNVECESRIVKDRTVAAGLVELARATHAKLVVFGLDGSIQKGLNDLVVVSDLFRHMPCEVLVAHEPIEGPAESAPIGRLIEPAVRR